MAETQALSKKEDASESKPSQTASVFQPLISLRDDVDRVFDQFFRHWPLIERRPYPSLFAWDKSPNFPMPALSEGITLRSDLKETDDGYQVSVEMPGMTDKDVDISVSDSTLTIKGEKTREKEDKDNEYHIKERSYGSFRRVFTLPPGVKIDDIAATVSNGVLTVTMPKTPEAKKKPRKITVKAS